MHDSSSSLQPSSDELAQSIERSSLDDGLSRRLAQHFTDAVRVCELARDDLAAPLEQAARLMFAVLANNNKILFCGNGGSAADAQHFAAELVGRFERERLPLAAIALSTDTSTITAIANDFGFEYVFSKQVQALGQAGDCLFVISTSGNSGNVLTAVEAAHERDMHVIALTGKTGGALVDALRPGDITLCVKENRTARIQEIHLLVLHALCDAIDAQLLGDVS